MVEYLRSSFEEHDTYIEGKKIGMVEAYEILDNRISMKISRVYPELKEAADA